MSIENPTLAHFRHFRSLFTDLSSTSVENSLQITPFYAKQTQFQKCRMNINTSLAMRYENLGTLMGVKTKPKQTQLKPIQTQFKPNKAKNKPNSNPIYRKDKKGANFFRLISAPKQWQENKAFKAAVLERWGTSLVSTIEPFYLEDNVYQFLWLNSKRGSPTLEETVFGNEMNIQVRPADSFP